MIALQRAVYGTTITPKDALYAATTAGARALGMENEIGSLAAGHASDLAVVDLSRARHRPAADPTAAVVQSAVVGDVIAVMIDGVWRFRSAP